MMSPKPALVNDDVRFRTCMCGCHAIYHDRDRGICRYYEECGCDGMTPELLSDLDDDIRPSVQSGLVNPRAA